MNTLQQTINLNDGTQLVLPLPMSILIKTAYDTITGKLVTAEDIAVALAISIEQAIKIITDPVWGQLVHNLAMANARQGFDAIAYSKLINLARSSESERVQIQSIKTLADLLGVNESKKKNPVNIEINLDSLVRKNSNSPFPGF